MKDVFDELREELESVDRWLDQLLLNPLPAHDRKLAESLKKYVAHCRRDKTKWRWEKAATDARLKVKQSWGWLYLQQARRR